MDKAAWAALLGRYAAYGVNCVRFHSWCPPEAAFAAADEAGMLLQPELSDWDFRHALEDRRLRRTMRGSSARFFGPTRTTRAL